MTGTPLLRIGARAGRLARAQAEWVAGRLACCTAMVWIRSGGDEDRASALTGGGAGLFTAALHDALRADRVDAAVHSLKNLSAAEEAGIALACVPVREDPRDVLVARDGLTLAALPPGARVGTASPRRVAQLRRKRPDLVFDGIRGSLHARVQRVEDGSYDAVVLALAGLRRLGREDVITEVFDPDTCLPAAGQGAIGITVRSDDAQAEACLGPARNVSAAACTAAERSALQALGAGYHAPVGALASVEAGEVRLRVRVTRVDGGEQLEAQERGPLGEARALGERVAKRLLAEGAGPLVEPLT